MKWHHLVYGIICGLLINFNALATVFYVDVNGTNPTPPFTNWSTAATDIQSAVDASTNGDLILVTNGIYQTGGRVVYGSLVSRVVINKAVTVQSVNGSAATMIQGNSPVGNGAIRCVYLTNNAILTGFTLTNGATRNYGGPPVNEHEQSGGGAYCESTNSQLIGCLVISNSALFGGGVHCGSLSNCAIFYNSAVGLSSPPFGNGGGIYLGILDNCILSNNSAGYSGGAACSNTLNNCILNGNAAVYYGGGAAYCTLNSCIVSNNLGSSQRSGDGGGAAFSILNNCMVVSNGVHSDIFEGGGGFSSVFNNCYIIGNQSYDGGGAANSDLYNCTVVGNGSSISSRVQGKTSTARNCIIYYNGTDYYLTGYMTNCCTDTVIPFGSGPGNFTTPPLFVNITNDFHLQSNSPCINAGNNAYVSGTNDLDGNPRIVGATVDIGAYEYQTPASILSYAWAQQYGLHTDGSADFIDSDGDGMNNWQEWKAGTIPTNAASVLQLASPANSVAGVKVTWQSVSGVTYYLQSSTNLAAVPAFTALQSNLVGQAVLTSYTDTTATNGGPYFYRVGVQ
jgi:hypothetical protein